MNPFAVGPQLVFVEHVLSEVRDLAADGNKSGRRNDHLELRDEDSVSSRAIPNPDVSAARVFLQNVRDVKSRNLAQHFRWERMNSHVRTPPAKVALYFLSAFARDATALSRIRGDLSAASKRKSGENTPVEYVWLCCSDVGTLGNSRLGA
jgi:hypothetical protein